MFKVSQLLGATQGKLSGGASEKVVRGISTDSRSIRSGEAFIAIKGDNFDGHDFINAAVEKGASCIIKDKKNMAAFTRRVACIEVPDTERALADIARFWRGKFNIPVVAVTGSNGKTTTKEMIAWVLSQKFRVHKNIGTQNNQIGLPQAILGLKPGAQIAVLELGTNHPGEIKYLAGICSPDIGIITNIEPSHLEHLGSPEGVLLEKRALIESLRPAGAAILNADDILLRRIINAKVKAKRGFIFSFGIKSNSDFRAWDIKNNSGGLEFLVNPQRRPSLPPAKTRGAARKFSLQALGRHNVYNALAAIAVARIFGMRYNDIIRRLSDFELPQGRLKCITVMGVRFIDDTYNANPASLSYALEALADFKVKGRKIFVMGDMLELGEQKEFYHRQAGIAACGACDAFIAVGRLSRLAASSARSRGMDSRFIFSCSGSAQARSILFDRISVNRDDVVLVKGSRLMKMEEVLKPKT